jgi:DNA end-binding protein Ku
LQKRERILMLEPFGKGLLAFTLRYANQVRSEGAAFEDIADVVVQEELLDLASASSSRRPANSMSRGTRTDTRTR